MEGRPTRDRGQVASEPRLPVDRRAAPRAPPVVHRALVIQLRRLGDVVLSLGLLEDLRAAYPGAMLDFMVGGDAAPLLDRHPLVRESIVFRIADTPAVAYRIRRAGYDLVVDAQSSPYTAALSRLTGAPLRAGWDIGFWAWTYTHRLSRGGRAGEYALRERQRLLELADVPVGPPRSRLVVSASEASMAESRLGATLPSGAARVALVLSGRQSVKEWPVSRFADLSRALTAEGHVPLALETPTDGDRAAELRRLAPRTTIVPAAGVRELLAVLSRCQLLVSADTGPAHMATALGVPRVTVYGPTSPEAWSPTSPIVRWVREPNRPALTVREMGDAGEQPGILGVTADDVMRHVRDLLSAASPAAREAP
jgi:ADP-heptose:LPS heptosyltransferase